MKNKTKKMLGRCLAFALTVCLFMGGGLADVSKFFGDAIGTLIAYAASSTTNNGFTWYLDDNGVLTITGSGTMPEYDWNKSSFDKSQVKEIVVGEGVTSISYSAFSECKSLTKVSIPDSVTGINS